MPSQQTGMNGDKLRILVIARSFPPLESAQALQFGKVVRAIQASGCNTTVIAGAATQHAPVVIPAGQVSYVQYWHCAKSAPVHMRAWGILQFAVQAYWPQTRWGKHSIARALAFLAKGKYDCIMSSSNPFESHLVALAIKQKTGLPWLASFNDPWPVWINPPPYNSRGLLFSRRLQLSVARKVLKECEVVHMPSTYGVEWSEGALCLPIKNKAAVIPHIGSAMLEPGLISEHTGWLAHAGDLTRERVSTALLAGIQKVQREIPAWFKGLLCIGNVCAEFSEKVRSMGLENIVKVVGKLPADDAVRITHSVSALLVIEADMPVSPYLPSKFADYALTGKPIIALTPPTSAIRDYLTKYGGGIPVSCDANEIARVLKNVFTPDFHSQLRVGACITPLAENFSTATVGEQYRAVFQKIKLQWPQ